MARSRLFDAWSRVYDARRVQQAVYRPVHDAVLLELRLTRAQRVLDIGCGTGLFTARVRDELQPASVVGVDFSAGMLEQAAARTREVSWVRGDATALPLGSGTMDAAVSTESFHWFPDQRAALLEVRRVLVPGGWFLVAFVNPWSRMLSLTVQAGARAIGQPGEWPTRAELWQLMRATGFAIRGQRRVRRAGGLPFSPILTVAEAR